MKDSRNIECSLEILCSTTDSHERNHLAMDLAETGDLRVRDVIIQLIGRSDLVNHRGTLVYALESYDMSDKFEFLIELVKNGNWEVAHQAALLIDKLTICGPDVRNIYLDLLEEIQKPQLNDWRVDLLKDLIASFE